MRSRLRRLRGVNRRLRDELGRSRRRMVISTAAAALLAVGAVAALQDDPADPVTLGVGRAGLKAAPAAAALAPPAPTATPAGEPAGGGEASFYGEEFRGKRTASGESFDPAALTAAHRTLPFGTTLRVTNLSNGRSVTVRVNDRGPFAKRRVVDLSHAAASRLGMLGRGTAKVRLEVLPD